MNEKFTVKTLPRVNSSKTLMARRSEGEPFVVVVLVGAGSTAPYAYSGRGNKSYWFEWDKTRQQHTLRVPASIWNAKDGVARDLLDQNKLTLPLIPLFEWDAPTQPTPTTADDAQGDPALGSDDAPVETKPDVGSEDGEKFPVEQSEPSEAPAEKPKNKGGRPKGARNKAKA